jgi:8-oxo-dGTP pyrophosphatase MutT (NUDIX family)
VFRKYATAMVISAEIAKPNAGLIKNAHRAEFNYTPRPGFLYARSRMISSRCNDNHDEFPAEEIRKAWKTAVGKPVFVNHHNEDHRRMRGVIIDAALHEDTLPDGRPDVWIEALHEIDAKRFPKLAEAIIAGRVNRTSMGTDVGFSVCSACGNKASTPAEYCEHIPRMKGKILYRHTASGEREGHLIREICYKLGFFENSFLVEDPADPTAVVTGVDDRGLKAVAGLFKRKQVDWQVDPDRKVQDLGNNFHLLNHLATDHGWGHDAFQSAGKEGFRAAHDRLHREGVPGLTDDEGMHFHGARSSLPRIAADRVPCTKPGCNEEHWGSHGAAGLLIRHHDPEDGQTRYLLQKRAPWVDYGGTWGIPGGGLEAGESPREGATRETEEELGALPDDLTHHQTHTDDHGDWAYHTVVMDSPQRFEPGGWDEESTDHGWFTKPEMKNMDLHPGFAQSLHTVTGGDMARMASSLPPIEAVRYDKPTDHPFFKDTKLSPKHIVAAYDEADEPTKAQGMRWYSDAHHIAKSLDPDGDAHRGAGVLAAYSPRSAWPINLFNASNTLKNRRAVRIGEGMNVMGQHAKSAAKLVEDNKHYFQVFSTPKITDFAHLIAHAGDDDSCPTCKPHKKDDYPKQAVVVDRHALSVAAGRRMNDNDLGRAPLGTRKYYEHVADQYRKAAKQISNRDGTTVHPHQLQAITWLQQQKRNATADEAESFGGKGRQTRDRNAWSAWEQHATDTHPGLMGEEGNIHLRNPHRKESSLPSVLGIDLPEGPEPWRFHDDYACPSCGSKDFEGGIGRFTNCADCGTSYDAGKSFQQTQDEHAASEMARKEREREYGGAVEITPSDRKWREVAGTEEGGPTPRPLFSHPQDATDELMRRVGPETRLKGPFGVPINPETEQGKKVFDIKKERAITHSVPHRLPEGPAQLRSLNSLSSLPRLAYGETKAPQDVDTLRAESCPVCGETDAFDGDRCQVCHFIQPPAMFTDPDTGVARQMDLKKDTLDQQSQIGPDGQPIPGQQEVDPNDPNGENQPMTDMPGQAGDQIADLFCPACGFSADTQEPMTNNDPSMPSEQQGLQEGDVCPNCGEATMLSPNDVGEMGGEVPQEVADDADANGIPDDQEPDEDQDGIPDEDEPDIDGDGRPDDSERDSDDDGVPDDADPDDADPEVPGDAGGEVDEPDDQADENADPVEDDDQAPKGRKDNARRAQ